MDYKYRTSGVCAKSISFSLTDGKIKNVFFEGGCNGNTQGISRLVEGMAAEEVVARCEGIRCGFKNTSCPDQLAKAIKEAINNG